MNKLKLFKASDFVSLEEKTSDWQKSGNFNIISSSIIYTGNNYVISIIYNEKPLSL